MGGVSDMTRPGERSATKSGIEPRSAAVEADVLPPGQRGGTETEVANEKNAISPSDGVRQKMKQCYLTQ